MLPSGMPLDTAETWLGSMARVRDTRSTAGSRALCERKAGSLNRAGEAPRDNVAA